MALKYVVQEHHATRLHYDLRLEHNGVARSWAIPKEPTAETGVKRLAVQVSDHEVEYMDFEGEIEDGYGAGKVERWDSGTWTPESVRKDKIVALIHGEKLSGRFALVRMMGKNWLFFKAKDKD